MQMLTKFESKSSRAKAVTFHPKRPWILVALHSSTVQLWDYRMGTIIDRFEGHDGPVRGVDFHPTQPLFASCGDDYTVRVWSLTTRKCLFTLKGHLDYVRTVVFHNDLPWLLSASDDQTIRIWNWQNRQEIACLTGHNHYVMNAQFHPRDDLVVSASLDQTVRVWDISGLRQRHSAGSGGMGGGGMGGPGGNSFEDQMARGGAQPDLFGPTDAMVKYVLEGHDRGVNWASFHPTLPLIVSGGDDRVLKLWRMSETKAWEVDTCRGHTSNVMCCVFHPFQDMILSVAEDKTLRTWDLNKRTPIHTFRRDNDKFWGLSSHPALNLFAAAHDGGVMVFKLERERPASTLHQNTVLYVNAAKQLQRFDLATGQDLALVSLKRAGSAWAPFRSLSYNPAERAALLTFDSGDTDKTTSSYTLVPLPKDPSGVAIEPTETLSGAGDQALFLTRNRFAVLNRETQTIDVRDLSNAVTKSVKAPIATQYLASGGSQSGVLLLLGKSAVALCDVQQKRKLAELPVAGVKYVVWSSDGQYVALLALHTITIATKSLELVSSLHETLRIKSAVWDDSGVLLYSTLNHLKYTLLNGDNGILKTLDATLYLVRSRGPAVACLTRAGAMALLSIDPTEYRFKQALVNRKFNEVKRLIHTSELVGQSIIAYLQQKGYPEVALSFVDDVQTKFDLALECGNLAVAKEQIPKLDEASAPVALTQLAQAALAQGNHDIVEDVYKELNEFDKLAFVYLVTGNEGRLAQMESIAVKRGDMAARFQLGIFRHSAESRVELLREAGMGALAYALAQKQGLDELAEEILVESGVDRANIKVETVESEDGEATPAIVNQTFQSNWPLQTAPTFFERALLGDLEDMALEEKEPANLANGFVDAQEVADGIPDDIAPEGVDGAEEWAFSGDEDLVDEAPVLDSQSGDVAETELWLRNSPLAADHVAAGSFESAAQLLVHQLGVADFAPLKPRFLEVYAASKLYLQTSDGLPPNAFYVRRNIDSDAALPLIPGMSQVEALLTKGYALIRQRKLAEGIAAFREILYTVAVLAVDTQEQQLRCLELVEISRNYILAFSIELERLRIAGSDPKRNLELAAYFTVPKLRHDHRCIPLQVAIKEAYSAQNFATLSYFATKFLALPVADRRWMGEKMLTVITNYKARADRSPVDAIEVDFRHNAEFDICPAELKPIYAGMPYEVEPMTGAKYLPSHKGELCAITRITSVGASASGLRLKAD